MQGLEGVPSAAIEPIPDYFSLRRLRVVNFVHHGLAAMQFVAKVPERRLDAFASAIPMRQSAKPAEIVRAVMVFALDKAGYIAGHVISVSGGLAAGGLGIRR